MSPIIIAPVDLPRRPPAPEIQSRNKLALDLDREADALLFLGRHAAAERLSHLACEMRAVAA